MGAEESKHKKLAFCFLVYDRVYHEDFWQKFFEQVDPSRYEIYVHHKKNSTFKSNGFLEKYVLPDEKTCPTRHGHPSLCIAQRNMYREALSDGCWKFLTISHSCVPFKNFEQVYQRCVKTPNSEFFSKGQQHAFQRGSRAAAMWYKAEELVKAEQWFILNRRCAREILSQTDYTVLKTWEGVFASDEHFFLTHLNSKKLIGKEVTLSEQRITFVNWGSPNVLVNQDQEMVEERKTNGRKPRCYSFIGQKEIEFLIDSPHLFGRKFHKSTARCFNKNKRYITEVLKA